LKHQRFSLQSTAFDGRPATAAEFNSPRGVAVDAAGNLLIADTGSNRIRSAAVGNAEQYLYWANQGGGTINETNLNGTGVTTLVTGQNKPVGVAVDGSHIYWANSDGGSAGTIMEANLNGSGVTTLVTGQAFPQGVAVNGSYIYWANLGSGTIMAANLNGSGVTTLVTGQSPDGVAVDSSHLYWANALTNTIMEANLDGTGVTTLVTQNVPLGPLGVAVDSSHIYWANANAGAVYEASLDGTGVTTLVTGQSPEGVAVDSSHLYWTNNNGTIVEANLDGTGVTTLVTGQSEPAGVAVGPASSSSASYIYDADGRLLAVVEPGSDAYAYRYDPVGNILSVTHQPAGLSILRVSPPQARPGQVVHVFGTGFSATAANDQVTIGGTATAAPTVVSPVQLDVTMPAGSTGGTVAITVGPATASGPVLGLAAPPPVISSVVAASPLQAGTLVVAPGAQLTITGTGFDPTPANDRVMIGQEFASVTSATATQLVVTTPSGPAFSGALAVTTPSGSATGPDVFSVPFDVQGSTYPVAARVTSGQTANVALANSGQTALLIIDGRAGQRLSVTLGNGTIPNGAIELFAPGGSPVNVNTTPESANQSFPFAQAAGILFVATLPRNGTYLLSVNPSSTGGTVPVTMSLFSDPVQSITPNGGQVTATVATPGRRVLLPFTVSAAEQVSVQYSGVTLHGNSPGGYLYLIDRTGQAFGPTGIYSRLLDQGSSGAIATTNKLVPGPYDIVVDLSQSGDTGSVTLQLHTFKDVTGAITPNGPKVTAKITVPGQRALYSFSGTAGSRISVQITGNTFPGGDLLDLLDPSGTDISDAILSGPAGFLATQVLPATGTYQLVVPSQAGHTGAVSLQLFSFADQTGTITPNGPAVTTKITIPGQRALYSFSVTSPVNATVKWSANTFAGDSLEILDPAGNQAGFAGLFGATGTLGPVALSSPGTYQVVVDPSQSGDTGSVTLQLTTVPAPHRPQPAGAPHVTPANPATPSSPAPAAAPRLPANATLSGVVLEANGHALPGVTLSIGGQKARSSALGRFTLGHLSPGPHLLQIDGTTAHPPGSWGFFTEVVNLVPDFPNQVPAPIWMTPLDNRHAVSLPQKITHPLVVTTPRILGLELRIPAGTVIRNRDGSIVRKISITPIRIDRPPFPLPVDAQLPSYFTIQPGGATIQGGSGVQLVYPNWGHQLPGTRMTFWAYGARWNGWWVYGHGTVTPDGKHVVPGKGTVLHDFQGAMFNSGPPPPPNGPACNCGAGDPVDLSTGLFSFSRTDMTEPDTLPLTLTRSYRQNDPGVYRFGVGTNDLYGINLWSSSLASNHEFLNVSLVLPNGRQVPYVRTTPGTFFTDAEFAETGLPGPFSGSIIDWNGNGWNLTLRDGFTYTFGEIAPLQSISDRYGNAIQITYQNGQSDFGRITNVTSPNGRWMQFSYHSLNCGVCVSSVADNSGRTTAYTYDASERLAQATDVRGHAESYAYDTHNNMTTVTDRLGNVVLTNTYNADNTVATQTRPGGGTVSFSYAKNTAGQVTSASFTDQRGATETMTFNSLQEPLTDTLASGTSLQRTTKYKYTRGSGLLTKVTDPLGRSTTYKYDGFGNLVSETQLAGTTSARTTTQTFEPLFSRLTSVTDPLGHTTRVSYKDTLGATTATITDPTGQTASVKFQQGNPVSVTDGAGNKTTATYHGGDLATVTNPDGQTASQFTDSAGFTRSITTPLGATTSYTYDPAGNLTAATDALGNVTKTSYDPVGNPVSFTDADGHTTAYTYDTLYRPTTETDPLGATQHFAYDTAGDLTSYTDRNGTVDNATYDLLGQLSAIHWGVTSSGAQDTTTYAYDKAGRLLTASDATNGAITNNYDAFDNLTSQSQPAGTITYTYDAGNRRTSMTPGTGPKVTYAYDAAGRPTAVTTGPSTATLSYDNAGRLATITDPGGLTETYTYDPASNITKITTTGASPLTLGYTYNADTQQDGATNSGGGLLAPAAVTSASYNAGNELTALNGTTLSYDANGALLNDGTNTYTRNAQHQLTSISNPSGSTTISNDPFGRQAAITTASGTTHYIHDGTQPALALAPTGPTSYANDPITGRTLLETSPTGTVSLTADRLNSTTAVAGSSGTTLSSYAYDPFGVTTVTHPSATTNDIGYAGYQQTTPSLDHTANRYYSPALNRFISQDPSGLTAGQNLYTYSFDNPINLSDPSGLDPNPQQTQPAGIDIFGFGSLSKPVLDFGLVSVEGEAVGLVGWNTASGPFRGDIFAGGVEIGEHNNYGAAFYGTEITNQGTTGITIIEGSIGVGVSPLFGVGVGAGVYRTGNGGMGFFLFVQGGLIGEYGSLGIGLGC
jgi:RHS repeat-associated protein